MNEFIFWFCVFLFLELGYLNLKNLNTRMERLKIIHAILHYNVYSQTGDYISANDVMEPYEQTLFRVWDWGYKRIVDSEIYYKIKPYI
jgi:hypothetical protein